MNKLSLHHKELKTKNKPNPKLLEEIINIRVEINQMRTKYKNPMKQRIDSFKKKKQGRKKERKAKEGKKAQAHSKSKRKRQKTQTCEGQIRKCRYCSQHHRHTNDH